MALDRRQFGLGAAAFLGASGLCLPSRAEEELAVLRAAKGLVRIAPDDYAPTELWTYGGVVPGPEIRVMRGKTVRRRFINNLPQPSTVHWHGIRIENAMDGVPDLTQAAVAPGAQFDYAFTAPDAGTYWYHPHNRTWEQLARGLSGILIVEEEGDPPYDRELGLALDDWRLDREARLHESFGAPMDRSHAGRIGNWVTVNGRPEPRYPAKRFERLRLRLVNTATARVFTLRVKGLSGWIVALDGQPLEHPRTLPEHMTLAPAQRIDLIADITASAGEEALIASEERGQTYAVTSFPVSDTARDDPLGPPEALPANDLPPLNGKGDVASVDLVMEGGAMGRMPAATLNGETLDARALAQRNQFWAFNGVVGMTKTPLVKVDIGQLVRLRMENRTGWPHAMHLHGHHFRKLGGVEGVGPWRDTELVARGETAEIAFVADNPGKWLLHCHMVDHADSGMMTWIEVG